jgi:hypothetical protein
MSSEFSTLREAWLGLDEPSQEVRESARGRLFEEIAGEESERLGRATDQRVRRDGLRPRSRLAIVLVLGLLLLLTWATLTLAFGWNVVFGSAPRAPHNSRVFKDFDALDVLAPPGMKSGVIADQTRLVATFGRKRLWVAPTRAGGYCFTLGAGGCDHLGTSPLAVTYSTSGSSQAVREVYGTVNPRWSESVELRFDDAAVIRPRVVWVSAPISQGFFYQPITADHRRPEHRLRRVVALDGDGNIVESENVGPDGKPYSNAPPPGAVSDQAAKVASLETPFGEAVLWHAPSRFDTSCSWLELAGRFYFLGSSSGCQVTGESPRRHGELARRGNLVLFYAFGIPSAGSVKLDFADGHHVRLRPHSDGFLLYRVAQPAFMASGQPSSYTVVAASGKQLLHADLSLPPLTSLGAERTVRLPDGQFGFLPRRAIVAKARKLIQFRAEQGMRVTVWVIPMHGGGRCYVYNVGSGCALPGSHAPPLGAVIHGGEPILLAGEVREDVATYELRYEDGAVERLHPVENFIMHEIPSIHYARGHRLKLVIARARDGHILAQEAVPVRAPGVYPCEKPVDFGHGVKACP